jgi:DNA-binding transcriptional LysR family regulator
MQTGSVRPAHHDFKCQNARISIPGRYSMPDLSQLRAFVVVAEEGQITRAAARLGMQQPPLTRMLHALEAELGTALMERHPKGIRLTAAGQALLAEARAVLQRADGIGDIVQRAARGEQGKLALGFTSSSALHPFVPDVIRAFRTAMPGVAVVLEEAGTAELVDAVLHERLDAAFVRSALSGVPDLQVTMILDEPMIVAMPIDHPLASDEALADPLAGKTRTGNPCAMDADNGDPLPVDKTHGHLLSVHTQHGGRHASGPTKAIRLADLASEAFVLYRRPAGPGLYDGVLAACQAAGFNPKVAQEAPRMTATFSLVAAGLGISIVPASMARLRGDGIAYRPLRDCAGLSASLYLATRSGSLSPACSRFVKTVLART